MWKVGGTKIERIWARYISLPPGHINSRKSDFLGKTLRTRKFFAATTYGILTHSGFRKYSWFGWPRLRLEVRVDQSEVKYRSCYEKSRGVKVSKSLRQFWSNRLETNRTWEHHIGVHVLFVSKWSDENWRSDLDPSYRNCIPTNLEKRVNFGHP